MGIDTNTHSDAASTNPKYDPDKDGDVENVDLSKYGGEVGDGTPKGDFLKVSTEEYYTAASESEVQSAVQNHEFIKLADNLTIDNTVRIEPENDPVKYILAKGTHISGSADPMFDIIDNLSQPNQRVEIHGGIYDGTGANTAVRVTDSYSHYVEVDDLRKLGSAIVLRNDTGWSEKNHIVVQDSQPSVTTVVDMRGANATGGTGSDSFRGTVIVGHSLRGSGPIIKFDNAYAYNARLDGEFHVNNGATGIRCISGNTSFEGSMWDIQMESTNSDGTEVGIDSDAGVGEKPVLLYPQFHNINTDIDDRSNNPYPAISGLNGDMGFLLNMGQDGRAWLADDKFQVEKPLNATQGAILNGDPALSGGTTSGISPGFDNWFQVDANRPSMVILDLKAETDGNTNGLVQIQVDESGGTTPDYSLEGAFVQSGMGGGMQDVELTHTYLPAGAQFRIYNKSDPNGANAINAARVLGL